MRASHFLKHLTEKRDDRLKCQFADYRFITPFISGDGDGNVTAIWYNQKHQLHFKIGENDVQYFKVWGTNIDTEMEGDYLKSEHYLDLWKWLINDNGMDNRTNSPLITTFAIF